MSFFVQNFDHLMTFYTPDVYEGPPREPGSYHQISVVSDDSSSKRVCYSCLINNSIFSLEPIICFMYLAQALRGLTLSLPS